MGQEEEGFLSVDESLVLSNETYDDQSSGSAFIPSASFRDIAMFPACIDDSDCGHVSRGQGRDYRCFQYMCYPWGAGAGPFRSCKRDSDCVELSEEEGGTGEDGACFKHYDRRSVR